MKKQSFRIKNPDEFFLNRLFASPKAYQVVENLSSFGSEFQATHITPLDINQLQHEGRGILTNFSFSGGIFSGFFHFLPSKNIKAFKARLNVEPVRFFYSLFYPVVPLFEKWSGEPVDFSIESSRRVNMAALKNTGRTFFLRTRFVLSDNPENYFYIYFKSGFLKNVGSFIVGNVNFGASKKDFLHTVGSINKGFKLLLDSGSADLSLLEAVAEKKDRSVVLFTSKYVNFDDFINIDDSSLRIILDELNAAGFTGKNLSTALSRSTNELKNKFYKNLSFRRRQEIAENTLFWEAPRDEVLKHQRTIVYAVVRLLNAEKISLNNNIAENVRLLEQEIRQSAKKEAEDYIRSDLLSQTVTPLSNRQMQLLIRRVGHSILISGLQSAPQGTKKRFYTNLSNDSLDLLKEDMAHWRKTQNDDVEAMISVANGQKKLVTESKRITLEEKALKTASLKDKMKEFKEEFIKTGI